MVESSKPVLVAITSSAKLVLKLDTKIIDEINSNEKTKTECELIIEMFYYLQLNLNEN
jgi:hypothetical protein